jgi:hypothetical protein
MTLGISCLEWQACGGNAREARLPGTATLPPRRHDRLRFFRGRIREGALEGAELLGVFGESGRPVREVPAAVPAQVAAVREIQPTT